jgi:hypothetical protein
VGGILVNVGYQARGKTEKTFLDLCVFLAQDHASHLHQRLVNIITC